jgi:hypothetical protein
MTSSRESLAWPGQNWPEWLWWENGIVYVFFPESWLAMFIQMVVSGLVGKGGSKLVIND